MNYKIGSLSSNYIYATGKPRNINLIKFNWRKGVSRGYMNNIQKKGTVLKKHD
jgi:hypothetical protein